MKENTRALDLDKHEVKSRFENAEEYAEALADQQIQNVTDNNVIEIEDINRDRLIRTYRSMIDEDKIWD